MNTPHLELHGSPNTYPPLPTLWDGDHIDWEAWKPHQHSSLEFHFGKSRCTNCGTDEPHWTFGRRAPSRGEVFEVNELRRTKRSGREYYTTTHKPAWPTIHLHATRCGWCGHTEVTDTNSNETWTLDDSDYGPTGSTRPNNTPHPDNAALAAAWSRT